MTCEGCRLNEATLTVGLFHVCEGCAIDMAWDRFLDAMRADDSLPPTRRRKVTA